MADMDFEIYDGKDFRGLCKDILDRADAKKAQVDMLYSDSRKYITDAASALNMLPQLKGLLETGIKNDEQLVKLAAILQRFQNVNADGSGGEGALSDADKDQLIREVELVKKELEKPIPEVSGSNKSDQE
jgi:superfamily I DNA/RNA helicase